MSPARPTVRTRFAPSPSGHLHVGGARTALFNWAYARGQGGQFIVRIEDTDQKRASDAASLGFLRDLKWLGIQWDEGPEFDGCGGGQFGPYFQSERLEIYHKFVQQLIDEGKAYRAFETPEELEAARQSARREKRNYRYDRAALSLDAATIKRFLSAGRPHVVRLRVPDDEEIVIRDEVFAEVRKNTAEMDDFVIIKADGYPTYHFAVVVDDELMKITHVIRAQEHLINTARHLLIQRALGFAEPTYAHVSIITNPDKSKMSKRDKDKALRQEVKSRGLKQSPLMPGTTEPAVSQEHWTWWQSDGDHQLELDAAVRLGAALHIALPEINVDDFRRAGYLPQVMVNYLALLGWSPGGDVEKFDGSFFVERFALDRVIASPAAFDRDKLLSFNLDALHVLPPAEFVRLYREHCQAHHPEFIEKLTGAQFEMLAIANQPRAKTLDDTIESSRFFIAPDESIEIEQTKAVRKAMMGGASGEPNGYARLEALLPALRRLSDWSVRSIEIAVREFADAHTAGDLGRIAQPLRIAVSGGTVSPAIFETLAILGRDSVVRRIERCLQSRSLLMSTSSTA